MKFLSFILIAFAVSIAANAQTTICYSYDAAGNRITKLLGPCNPSEIMAPHDDGPQTIADGQLIAQYQLQQEQRKPTITGRVIPNPTDAIFEINLDMEPPLGARFELFDGLGRLIQEQPASGFIASFNISKESPGIYYVYLKAENGAIGYWKVVKQ